MIPRTFMLALAVLIAVGTMILGSPARALAFPQSTETQGEIEADMNGVWLVVHHLEFDRPTPKATPAPPGTRTKRVFNVLNLLKIEHLKKEAAQKVRNARSAKQEASIAKAKALIAADASAQIPVQTDEGEIEGGPRVIVPQIPRPPGYDPIIHAGDHVSIDLLDVTMPASVDEAFQAAQKAETSYEPSDKELALLRSSWSQLERKKDGEYNRIEWKVVAATFYDQQLQIDPKLANTSFMITGTQGMLPRPSQPSRNIVVYGIRKTTDDEMSGTHSRAIMATAPFPIPIEMNGNVRFIKIADLPDAETDEAEAEDAAKEQPAS